MNRKIGITVFSFIWVSTLLSMDFGALYRQATEAIEEKVPAGQVILISKEGKEFQVPQNIAEQSKTLKAMIEDVSTNRKVPLNLISSQTLEEIVNLLIALHKHANVSNKALLDSIDQEVKVTDPYRLLEAANYLDIPSLITLVSRQIAKELASQEKDLSQKTYNKIVQKIKESRLLESIFHQYYLLTGIKAHGFKPSIYTLTAQETQDYPIQNKMIPSFPNKSLALMAGATLASTLTKPKKVLPGKDHLDVETISLITQGKEFHVPLEIALGSKVIQKRYQNSLMHSFDVTGIGISPEQLELLSDLMWALENFKYLKYTNLVEALARHTPSNKRNIEELLGVGVQMRFKPAIILAAYSGDDKVLSSKFQSMKDILSLPKKSQAQIKQELTDLGYYDLARYYYIFHKSKLSGVNPKDYGLSIKDYLNYSPEYLTRAVIEVKYGNVLSNTNQSITVLSHGSRSSIIRYDNSLNLSELHLNSLDGLSNIPNIETITYLDLSNNNLSDLEQNHFLKMSRLTQLDLRNNSLKAIQAENTFNGATNLEILDLDGNDLAIVNPNIFKLTPNLKRLSIDRKKLNKPSLEFIHTFKPYLEEGKIKRQNTRFWSRL